MLKESKGTSKAYDDPHDVFNSHSYTRVKKTLSGLELFCPMTIVSRLCHFSDIKTLLGKL